VRVSHHLELSGAQAEQVRFRNVFAPELESSVEADALVLALGRVPLDALAGELADLGLPVHAAGDCLSPRSADEAILEGTLAVRRATLA
jgi:hypothetical protein